MRLHLKGCEQCLSHSYTLDYFKLYNVILNSLNLTPLSHSPDTLVCPFVTIHMNENFQKVKEPFTDEFPYSELSYKQQWEGIKRKKNRQK